MAKYLILGNSAGAIGAVEAIREIDRQGSIALVSDEPYPAYSRPMISEYLAGQASFDKMLFRPKGFYEKMGVETLLGRRAVRLGLDRQCLELEGGDRIAWDRLLLATGGAPFIPKMEGQDRKGVVTFTKLDDAKAIDAWLPQVRRVVVIGGGLIGVSVSEALVHRGVEVTIVELKDRILNIVLDEEGSSIAAEALRAAGVRIITERTVEAIEGSGRDGTSVGGVLLDDGQRLLCELVVVAIGVVPRLDLARENGITVNRGIVVDRHMATSHPGVYACGDVAEAHDFIYGINRVIPIWPSAFIGGRIAGHNMAGESRVYAGATPMNSLKYFGLTIVSAGIVSANGDAGFETLQLRESEARIYKKVVLKDGLITGLVMVGDIDSAGVLHGLMRDGVPVSEFKDSLLAGDFSLISLPAEVRRAKLRPAS